MKRLTICVLLLLGFSVILWAGAKDFWQSKPYTEWTEKEVEKMLTDSPWVQKWYYDPSRYSIQQRDPSGELLRAQQREASSLRSQMPTQPFTLLIAWSNARPWKAAVMRNQQLATGTSNPEQEKAFIEGKEPLIRIQVMSTNPRLLRELTTEQLQENTYLEVKAKKKTKLPIARYAPPDKNNPNVALYIFPKEHEGNPVLSPEVKEIIFRTLIVKAEIEVKFKTKDMTVNNQIEW